MIDIDQLLSRLQRVKSTGHGKWLARCPAHDDRSPSLAIKMVDEKILLHDFGGCSVEAVLAAIGMTMGDLFPESPKKQQYHGVGGFDRYQTKKQTPKFSRYELFPKLVFESTILAVAIEDLLNGRELDDIALARVNQTIDTISALRFEIDS